MLLRALAIYMSVLPLVLLSACMPTSMHVSKGSSPNKIDDDVRFQATYYFRTFDYCWDADAKQPNSASNDVVRYTDIIPQTDTLYRYRMTGKANALFNKVRFESGTLRKEQIDPFGSDIRYSTDADGFYVRSEADVRAEADAARRERQQLAERDRQLERIRALTLYYSGLKEPEKGILGEKVKGAITDAMASYLAITSAPSPAPDTAVLSEKIDAVLAELGKVKSLSAQTHTKVEELMTAYQSATIASQCALGQTVRKGFQIMGPEGLRTFDQNERLVLAMSTSNAPLIETLRGYSGRILAGKGSPESRLLPIAKAMLTTEQARRTLADMKAANPDPVTLFDAVDASFSRSSEEGKP